MTLAEQEQEERLRQSVLMLWRRGEDTKAIADRWGGITEAEVASILWRAKGQPCQSLSARSASGSSIRRKLARRL